jgi:RNA polymerase sigma-70 factor (sigma-E family)
MGDMGRQRLEEFQAFYSAESARLERFATMLVGDPFQGADLTQEALARVFSRWGRIEEGSASAYARQIILNLVRSAHRSRKVRSLKPVPGWAGDGPVEGGQKRVDDTLPLIDALRQLPAARRATVLLRFYEDMTEHQIARTLDRPLGTVKSDIHRALRQLRPLLEEERTEERRR